jgi:cytochrome P450
MSEQQARDEAMTVFLAGHETSSIVLTMTLYLLAAHPNVQSQLQAEVDTVLGNRRPMATDVARLTFMKQVVNESMRLYPPIWLLGRMALEEDRLGPYRVKKGATVAVPVRAIHRMEKYYSDPEEFHPERWTPEFERDLPRAAFLPFGVGPRTCMGAGFAMLEMQLALAMILQKFRLTLESERNIVLQPSATSRCKSDILIGLKSRS